MRNNRQHKNESLRSVSVKAPAPERLTAHSRVTRTYSLRNFRNLTKMRFQFFFIQLLSSTITYVLIYKRFRKFSPNHGNQHHSQSIKRAQDQANAFKSILLMQIGFLLTEGSAGLVLKIELVCFSVIFRSKTKKIFK